MRVAVVAGVLLVLSVAGCGEKAKCAELATGKTYQVTTLEPLSAEGDYPGAAATNRGLPSCNGRDGFRAGSAIKLFAREWIEGRQCFFPLATVGGYLPGQPADSRDVSAFFSDGPPEVPFYVGAKKIVLGGCPVTVLFGVEHTLDPTTAVPRDVLGEPEPGVLAPAALHRYIVPAGDGCEVCGDVFAAVVRLSP